jgi:predicted SAM-dependent methyltransferase
MQNMIKLNIGCGAKKYKGWLNLDKKTGFNVCLVSCWDKLGLTENSVDNILSEHMLEHLSDEDRHLCVKHFYYYLKPGGIARIAVPDGYRPNPTTENPDAKSVDIFVPGQGRMKGHKYCYTLDTLCALFAEHGFVDYTPVEYYDENGVFHKNSWTRENGFVKRSYDFDKRNRDKKRKVKVTSLFVDFKK